MLNYLEHGNKLPKRVPLSIKKHHRALLKWNLIESMQKSDTEMALDIWDQLKTDYPDSFGEFLKAKDPRDNEMLFFKTVHKLQEEFEITKVFYIDGIDENTKLGRLYHILYEARFPMRKEDLIEAVWETAYSPDYDARFYKLIQRLKNDYQADIMNKNYTYKLGRRSKIRMAS